jgi:(p)ppGpp synthase/HD superfamily hydrolase
MSEIDADEAEIIRIISNLPEFAWLATAELDKIRHEIKHKISKILREYYLENTRSVKNNWTKKFNEYNISEDDGKIMITCARRLGIEIS